MATVSLPRGYKRLKAACRVPASVANLGPGFDCLGLALGMHNELAAEIGTSSTSVEVHGEGEDDLPRDENNLVVQAMYQTFERLKRKPVPVWVRCTNRIPLSRGLGSSSAAIVGGVFLANELCGRPWDRPQLFQLAAEIEGHPDNVAPALMGGLTVSVTKEDGSFETLAVELDSLSKWKYVVVIPDFSVDTAKARKLLPNRVTFDDAVHNVGRSSLLVAALLKGPSKSTNAVLREAMKDALHQPHRSKLISGRDEVMAAAYEAGALGVCVSGSGPALLAIGSKWATRIGEAMVEAFASKKQTSRYEVLPFEPTGTISLGVHNF
ncbi:Homoserine kinase [Planctomycetes bacterium Pan216]|uniref:Homoserine kinase n=1 Tax=Kolteria novifilia TaxID=2527975 RepID=A0A518B2W6_9BACT|nr:Homoserine kinase [Planctomycetes bacterium Pan216]